MTPANDAIADDLVDRLLDLYWEELQKWNIVGPLEERRPNLPPRPFWNAVRTEISAIDERPTPTIIHFKEREHATACVQWHGLKVVLTAFLGELATFASETGDKPNG